MTEAAVAEPVKKATELGKDLAVVNQGNAVVPMPSTHAQMVEFAQLMSRGGPMIGKPFRESVGACLGILTQAMRWGMDPYSCSQKAYLVNDVIGYEAQLIHAVILKNAPLSKRPRPVYSGSGDTRTCRIIFHVIGEDEPFEYESPPKADIKPQNSPLWKTDPDQQLFYYSVRAGSRRHFPDIIMGIYTPEELREGADRNAPSPLDGGAPITLMGAAASQAEDEPVTEAEFTDVAGQLERRAAGKKAAPRKGKGGGQTTGDAGVSSGEDSAKPTPAAAKADPDAQTAAAPKDDGRPTQETTRQADTSAGADNDADEDEADSDEAVVAGIEKAEKEARRQDKGKAIAEARGALRRISETTEDAALKARADTLLNKYED
jgi:hypothetical protein